MARHVARNQFAALGLRGAVAGSDMPVNVYETETGIAIDATLPGFDKDDIEVTLEEGRLSIRAEHDVKSCEDAGHDHEDRRYRYREVYRRSAERSFEIGDRFDSDAIQAELGKGVLHLELPRAESAQTQKVEINDN